MRPRSTKREGIEAGGIKTLWDESTAGMEEFGFLRGEVSASGETEAVINPDELEVKLMSTLDAGGCMLVNYTKPVRKGASVSLSFEPSEKLIEFTVIFLDEHNMPPAALDALFGRYATV